MKFLVDTNILIPLEPTSTADVKPDTPLAAEFLRLAEHAKQQVYIHPAALVDLARDTNVARRGTREILLKKYLELPHPPAIQPALEVELGVVPAGSNHWVDHTLLAALQADAIDYLVTEDRGIHRKARRLGLESRVATIADAASIIRALFDTVPRPPPAVKSTEAFTLDSNDPIFNSFRVDYHPHFDGWLSKCKREHRQTWVIEGARALAALCIVKQEDVGPFGLRGKVLKVCSFKVSEDHLGFRFGELLLKTVFDYASTNQYAWVYVTAFEKQTALLSLFEDFGFELISDRTSLGELILTKPMIVEPGAAVLEDPLAYHRRYGPANMRIAGVPCFAIPIQPHYHAMLFPEAEGQGAFFVGQQPFGNSIRKAYLSGSNIRLITPGSCLVFYRSKDWRTFTVVGVAEDTLVSRSPSAIARHVAKRTVYSYSEIESLCRSNRDVLTIRFRQARLLKNRISLQEMVEHGALTAVPQSIVKIREEATTWLQTRIGA